MARRKKQVVLRPVDDDEASIPVIRLGKLEDSNDDGPPIRLGPEVPASEVRLELDADPNDFRTFQPGIEVLIEVGSSIYDQDQEDNWGQKLLGFHSRFAGWFALAAAFMVVAIFWSLCFIRDGWDVAEKIRFETHQIISEQTGDRLEAEKLVSSIESTIRSYFSYSNQRVRLRWVRHPERVEPLMRKHEQESPYRSSLVRSIRNLQPLSIHRSTDFWLASILLVNGERRGLIVETSPDGPKIDWETMVCYQPMPWDDFAVRRPSGMSLEFRVYVERSSFHSHEFHDEAQWACFRLTALNSESVLFGFARRGSEEERQLSELTNGVSRTFAVLRLHVPSGLQSPNGVVIEKMVSDRWLLVESSEQE